jgi:hypothetical protein
LAVLCAALHGALEPPPAVDLSSFPVDRLLGPAGSAPASPLAPRQQAEAQETEAGEDGDEFVPGAEAGGVVVEESLGALPRPPRPAARAACPEGWLRQGLAPGFPLTSACPSLPQGRTRRAGPARRAGSRMAAAAPPRGQGRSRTASKRSCTSSDPARAAGR